MDTADRLNEAADMLLRAAAILNEAASIRNRALQQAALPAAQKEANRLVEAAHKSWERVT